MPNLRGGGEYGDAWHEAGMLDKKQNVFDDFIAAAEWLIAQGYTKPARLAIAGGSNGGLLTGAALTQRPELFRAGDRRRAAARHAALPELPDGAVLGAGVRLGRGCRRSSRSCCAYSPYQHVKAGTKYPAVLLTAGEHDSRVHALARAQDGGAAAGVDGVRSGEQPVLLWVDREAGHGQGKPLNLRIRDAADQRIFVMWQLGMLDR